MELIELIVYLLEAIAEIGTLFERAERNFIAKCIGWIGLLAANLLTWGRVDWETDDWQALVTGAITICVGIALAVKCCLLSAQHTESTSCVFALRCSVA